MLLDHNEVNLETNIGNIKIPKCLENKQHTPKSWMNLKYVSREVEKIF